MFLLFVACALIVVYSWDREKKLCTHLLTLSMASRSGGGMEKQTAGATLVSLLAFCTTQFSWLLLSCNIYFSPISSRPWKEGRKTEGKFWFWENFKYSHPLLERQTQDIVQMSQNVVLCFCSSEVPWVYFRCLYMYTFGAITKNRRRALLLDQTKDLSTPAS